MIYRLRVLLFAALVFALGCAPNKKDAPRLSLFVGVDISGSFTESANFNDAIRFLSYYLYGHLNGIEGLKKPRALFVSSIGGDTPNEPKAFHPIQEFERKSSKEIEAKLRELFSTPGNYMTDFNAFFKRISEVVQKRSLVLAPLTIVIVSDGVPDFAVDNGQRRIEGLYEKIDLSPLEYLARNVTIRILYPNPTVAVKWERIVPRERVRIWPVEAEIMQGWREQIDNRPNLEEEKRFWKWIREIVDHRVRRKRIL